MFGLEEEDVERLVSYAFRPMPVGELMFLDEEPPSQYWGQSMFWVAFILAPLLTMLFVFPGLRGTVLVYLVLALFYAVATAITRVAVLSVGRLAEALPWTLVDAGPDGGRWPWGVALGCLVGLAALLMPGLAGAVVRSGSAVLVEGGLSPVLAAWFYAVIVPCVETQFMFGWGGAYVVERLGWAPGGLTLAFAFSAWHYAMYGEEPPVLLALGVYAFLSTMLMVAYRSTLPVTSGHVVINAAALKTWLAERWGELALSGYDYMFLALWAVALLGYAWAYRHWRSY